MKPIRIFCIAFALTAILSAGGHEIFDAIKQGDEARLKALVREDKDLLEVRDAEGNTALMIAAMQGTAGMVRWLVEEGAKVNATNVVGTTALMLGSYQLEKAKALVEQGAEVNARTRRGTTALMMAARVYGNYKTVKLLLDHGAEVNGTNVFGTTALMSAAASEDERNMGILLKRGASVNAALVPGPGGAIWGGGRSPLAWAAHRGDLKAIQLLLRHGAEVNGMEGFGTALTQTAWGERVEAAKMLLKAGAAVNVRDPMSDYTPLHWAASTESGSAELVKLLLQHGAEVNAKGGEPIDAFMGTLYTPLMLARKRGETEIVRELERAGGTGESEARKEVGEPERELPERITAELIRFAMGQAIPRLEKSARESRVEYANHSSKQNCLSCHQHYLPVTALGYAKQAGVSGSGKALEEELKAMLNEVDEPPAVVAQTFFHPEPVHSYGYSLLGLGANDVPMSGTMESRVYHLAMIQGPQGNWYNNLPRPPIQTSDVTPTALGVQALARYPLAGRRDEIERRVDRARRWLRDVEPRNTEEQVFKLLGLHWSGEPAGKLQKIAHRLLAEQRADGGWGQLPGLGTDGYATGQALFALHEAAGIGMKDPRFEKGVRFLLKKQLADGTWFAPRRAFPFQPTMKSGFPHGRDGWLSATATSWATMGLSVAMRDLDRPVVRVGSSRAVAAIAREQE